MKRLNLFYGWIIVAIAVSGMTLIYGIRHTFGIFFPYILDEFGWSRASTAGMFSLTVLLYGFSGPVAGSLGDRWQPRKVMLIGISIVSLATMSCSFAHALWHFYLLFGILVPVGTALSGWPLLAPALVNWFAKGRGLAIGLGQMGGGFSIAYGMFAEFIISHVGWRGAYIVLGSILVAFVLPLYLFLFHSRPEDRGLRPYGAEELPGAKPTTSGLDPAESSVPVDWSLRQAMGTYRLWLMVLSQFFYWGMGNYLIMTHQVKFAEDAGYSSMVAASVFSISGIFMVLGQLSSSISDWIGREKTITIGAILSIGSLVALVMVRDTSQQWLLYVYAICFGLGAGLHAPTLVAGTADIFHGKCFGAIVGLLQTGMGLGGAIGPWIGGLIYDVSGSYVSAFILCMVCFALACIAVWIAAPRNGARA